jgi:DNA modification methylase
MKIEQISVDLIKPYAKNPRKNKKAVATVITSIKEFGFKQPIVVDKDMTIVVGHTRYQAARELNYLQVPVLIAEDLTENQIKAYRIMDNKSNEAADWDIDLLLEEFADLEDYDLDLTGFNESQRKEIKSDKDKAEESWQTLSERYLINPFTILDARQGSWLNRKRSWIALGINSEEGREDGLAYPTEGFGSIEGKGTSIFDPFLTEVLYTWFSNQGHHILDPFAGGSVRGIVASMTGRSYTGIDLRTEQITANQKQWEATKQLGYPLKGYNHKSDPIWHTGDSSEVLDDIEKQAYDLLFTCPPYADLEVYSNDPKDISNMNIQDFLTVYETILTKAVEKLKDNRFAVIVIGEARDKNGNYYNLIGETIRIMKAAGLELYNELIVITPNGTLSVRAERPFKATRKVGKHHQNALVFLKGEVIEHHEKALVFVKGDGKTATEHAGRIEVDSINLLLEEDNSKLENFFNLEPDNGS